MPLLVGNTFLSEIKALDILFKSLWLFISFLMEKESLPYFRCQQLVGRVVDICPKADSPTPNKQGVRAFVDRAGGDGGYVQKQHSHLLTVIFSWSSVNLWLFNH